MYIEPETVCNGLLKRIPGTEIYFVELDDIHFFDSADSALKFLETANFCLAQSYKNDCPSRRRALRDLKAVREQLRFLALVEKYPNES